jgi:hypothetical protein
VSVSAVTAGMSESFINGQLTGCVDNHIGPSGIQPMTRVTSLRCFVGDCVGTEPQVACSNHLEPLVQWSEFAANSRALVSVE